MVRLVAVMVLFCLPVSNLLAQTDASWGSIKAEFSGVPAGKLVVTQNKAGGKKEERVPGNWAQVNIFLSFDLGGYDPAYDYIAWINKGSSFIRENEQAYGARMQNNNVANIDIFGHDYNTNVGGYYTLTVEKVLKGSGDWNGEKVYQCSSIPIKGAFRNDVHIVFGGSVKFIEYFPYSPIIFPYFLSGNGSPPIFKPGDEVFVGWMGAGVHSYDRVKIIILRPDNSTFRKVITDYPVTKEKYVFHIPDDIGEGIYLLTVTTVNNPDWLGAGLMFVVSRGDLKFDDRK